MRFSLDSLKRTTNSKQFIPEIDGLRFFAIVTVVFFHLNTAFSEALGHNAHWGLVEMGDRRIMWTTSWWWSRLDIGVKVFFSISGFVLALPFLKSRIHGTPEVRLGDYFLRRLTRLEPPFVVTLVAFLVVHVLLLGDSLGRLMPHFLTGLLYSHVLVYGYPNPINPVTWSLETEAQFYVLVPFLFMAVYATKPARLGWLLPTALAVLSVVFRWHAVENPEEFKRLGQSILSFFVNFATGILFAWIYLTHPSFVRRKNLVWDAVGAAALVLMFVFYKPQHEIWKNLALNACVLAYMLCVFKGPLFNWFHTRPFVYVTGGMCYTIYLLHFAFLFFALRFTKDISTGYGYTADLLLQAVLVLPVLLTVSAAFFLLVEKPCMDKGWPKRLAAGFKRKSQTARA